MGGKFITFCVRLWNSPTLLSWISISTRAIGFVLVLPFILTRLSKEEIALWFLFATINYLQVIADIGFRDTFSRAIAYAMGGASDIGDFRNTKKKSRGNGPNWEMIVRIVCTLRKLYLALGIGWFFLAGIIGTWSAVPLLTKIANCQNGWVSWITVLIIGSVRMYGIQYSASLFGYGKVALLKRCEALGSFLFIVGILVVFWANGKLLSLVVVSQVILLINVFINFIFARNYEKDNFGNFVLDRYDRRIMAEIWPRSWRSGIGVIISAGLIQGTGVFYARVGSTDAVAAYLLSLNFLRYISQFCRAPFYNKVTILAKLRSEGKLQLQQNLAAQGMRWSFWTLVAGIIGVGLFANPILRNIGAHIDFIDSKLWALLGFGLFLERYGAMHLQLYSITNHIIWHVANGITGLIYVSCVLSGYRFFGLYVFPIAQIMSNLIFYCWFSAKHSYKAFKLNFNTFEIKTSLAPLIVFMIYFIGIVFNNGVLA